MLLQLPTLFGQKLLYSEVTVALPEGDVGALGLRFISSRS